MRIWNTIQPTTKSRWDAQTTFSWKPQSPSMAVESEKELYSSKRLGACSKIGKLWRRWQMEPTYARAVVQVLLSCIKELKFIPKYHKNPKLRQPACDDINIILKPLLNKDRSMNYSAIQDVKDVMESATGQSTERTDRPGHTITKLQHLGNLVVISLRVFNANCGRSLDANLSGALALNDPILYPAFCLLQHFCMHLPFQVGSF